MASYSPPAAADRKTAKLSVRGVGKIYDLGGGGIVEAVRDVSFDVMEGEICALLGPSGCGKSTVLRMVAGLEDPSAGAMFLNGKPIVGADKSRGMVFQRYTSFDWMTVQKNVEYGMRINGVSRAERRENAERFIQLVKLTKFKNAYPHELSGGMQQRVALARALANDPAVLLLDEPLGALDRKLRDEMQRELRRVQSELGATFIYVTHDQDEAFGMADRLAVMRDGRFEQVGAPAEIYDAPANAWVALFVGSANRLRARLTAKGVPAALQSDFGAIAAGHLEDGASIGDTLLVVVRPEATHFAPFDAKAAPAPNRFAARLVDKVAIGPSLRQRAVTPGGLAVEAVVQRLADGPSTDTLSVGDDVFVSFSAGAACAYRDDTTPQARS